jgi:glycosyltransferase involved in cell wall biosynthesis
VRIVGMMFVYNEADIIGQTIEHLASQGVELVVLDNGSTDGSLTIINDHIGNGVLSVERIQTAGFESTRMIRILHAMAIKHSPDWILLSGADEFLESPYRGMTLNGAVQLEDARGFNLIQFNNFEFYPTEKDDSQERDVRRRLRYYSWHDDFQYRCWKAYPGMSVFTAHGHDAKLPDGIRTKVSPNKFVLRHYKIRSYEHGLRKVFSERLPRFAPEERAKGWNIHYDNYGTDKSYFIVDSSSLTRYDEDGNWNVAKTFDGTYGAWNPPSASERISKLRDDVNTLKEEVKKRDLTITELKGSLALQVAKKVPGGAFIRRIVLPIAMRVADSKQFHTPWNPSYRAAELIRKHRNHQTSENMSPENASSHVTVLIPAYNRAEFITEALDSMSAQDYPHYDVVVVDDGSTDETGEIVKSRPSQERITLIQIKHGGCAAATSVGIEHARGPIVTVLDSDDKLMSYSLSTVVPFFEKNRRLGYVWTNWVESNGNPGGGDYLPAGKTLFDALMSGWWKACTQRFFRKEFYLRTRRIDPSVKYAADFQLALLIAKTGCETLHIPKVTYWHRLHPHRMGVEHHDEQVECIRLLIDRFSGKNN